MSDHVIDPVPPDLETVNISEHSEVRWWSMKFAVTEDQLRSAVDAVGPTPAEIERHLKEAATKSFKSMGED
jgi:hypothetical protein